MRIIGSQNRFSLRYTEFPVETTREHDLPHRLSRLISHARRWVKGMLTSVQILLGLLSVNRNVRRKFDNIQGVDRTTRQSRR